MTGIQSDTLVVVVVVVVVVSKQNEQFVPGHSTVVNGKADWNSEHSWSAGFFFGRPSIKVSDAPRSLCVIETWSLWRATGGDSTAQTGITHSKAFNITRLGEGKLMRRILELWAWGARARVTGIDVAEMSSSRNWKTGNSNATGFSSTGMFCTLQTTHKST